MKTPGQIAHDAGKKAGRWARNWNDMSDTQKQEWEAVANAVMEIEREVCAKICDEIANNTEPDDFALDAVNEAADAIRMRSNA